MHVRCSFRDETTKAERRPTANVYSIIRYYGISCRVVMAASARPAAIHGQICTATRYNKRRPLIDAAPAPRCPAIISVGSTPKPSTTHRRCIAAHAHIVVVLHSRSLSKFSPPPRILTPTLFKRSEATRRNPTPVWAGPVRAFVSIIIIIIIFRSPGVWEARSPPTLASDVT